MDEQKIRDLLDVIDSSVLSIRDELGDVAPPPPPPPPPPPGEYEVGVVPDNGWLETQSNDRGLRLAGFDSYRLEAGRRLSGTVEFQLYHWDDPGQPIRLTVDGVPQPTMTIDTTQWEDGTHALGVQFVDQPTDAMKGNTTYTVVINNSGAPLQTLENHVVKYAKWGDYPPLGLSWARVNVRPQVAYPLDPQLDRHPVATNDADRQRLVTESIWWVEGLHHQGSGLWTCLPMLVKNRDGDYFILQWNPEGGGAGDKAVNAEPWVRAAPKFDGPRGIGNVSPYATMIADRHHELWDGQLGWMGVDKSGRVFQQSITGEVRTLLGPRNISGVVPTSPYLIDITLEDRIAMGEVEVLGENNGTPLKLSHDIWVCDSFPFEGVIADTGNDRVVEIHFGYPDNKNPEHSTPRLMRSWHIPGVTSVWGSTTMQRSTPHISWFAVSPAGLWQQRVINVNPDLSTEDPSLKDEQGKTIAHLEPELVATVPDGQEASWVRVHEDRVFIVTMQLGVYEYVPETGDLIERFTPLRTAPSGFSFVYANMDHSGSIGPIGRLYFGGSQQKTTINWLDINTFETGELTGATNLNRQSFGSWQAGIDSLGHYMWGIAPHPALPKYVSAGITSSSWLLRTACLGEQPTLDPPIPLAAEDYGGYYYGYDYEEPDDVPAISAVWGYRGHGMIGYSCDQFRDYDNWEDARQPIMEALEPFLDANATDAEKERIGRFLFMQRTRKRFTENH